MATAQAANRPVLPPRTGGHTPNFILQRRLCQSILGKEGTKEYEEFTQMMRRQFLAGVLPPAIMTLILHYGYGKPVDEIHIQETKTADPMAGLSEEQLRERARQLANSKFSLVVDEKLDGSAQPETSVA